MRDDELDEAIDDAVRAVLGAAPPPGMRQRVLRRIAEGEPVRGSRRLSWAVAAATLAVSVVVGAVIVERQQTAESDRDGGTVIVSARGKGHPVACNRDRPGGGAS